MRAVVQRAKHASVSVDGKIIGQISHGLLVLLAVHKDDEETAIAKMAEKIVNLRIFGDQDGKMNLSVKDVSGAILVVSQFTLYGDCRRGNRPSFIESAGPEKAIPMYEKFVEYIRSAGIGIETGEFGAHMEVDSVNDGPVTVILDI